MKYLFGPILLISLASAMILKDLQSDNITALKTNYPVRFVYIDRINQWWPP